MGPMRILLWHGYLLGGTGSNVYTRALAREWSRAGHDVIVFARSRIRSCTTSAARGSCARTSEGCCPTFVLDRYEGLEAKLVQDLTAEERERYVALNAAALREHLPADLVFANHVAARRPGRPPRAARASPSRRTAPSSSTRCAGTRSCRRGGGSRSRVPRPCSSAPQHIREVLEEVVGHVDRVHEVPPGVDIELFAPLPRDEALRDLLAEAGRSAEPRQRERAPPRRGERRAARGVLRRRRADGSVLRQAHRNKGVHVLLEALRDLDARAVDRRLRRLPRRAGGARPARHALHRRARAPAPRRSWSRSPT